MKVQTSGRKQSPRFYVSRHLVMRRGKTFYFVKDRALNCILGTFDSKENAELFCEAKENSLKNYLT